MPAQSDYLGLWLKQFDAAATMQLPGPREKQLWTAAARMISVEYTSNGGATASDGLGQMAYKGTLGFGGVVASSDSFVVCISGFVYAHSVVAARGFSSRFFTDF